MNPNELYARLYARYGDLDWWPAESPYEVMVGAVLTQNTAWRNVEKAIANLNASGMLTPSSIEAADTAVLSDLIRPAGFFKQKAVYLKALTAWYKRYGYSVEMVRGQDTDALRRELLAVRGVGRETADAVLLYAFGLLSFVVDAYTFRLLERLGVEGFKRDYETVKGFFENSLPCEERVYNNLHACIVVNAKEHCRAKPVCGICPLADCCKSSQSIPPLRINP